VGLRRFGGRVLRGNDHPREGADFIPFQQTTYSNITMAAPTPQTFPYDYLFKVLIIGDASVGKVRGEPIKKLQATGLICDDD
jgi:hypothetical protein